MKMESYIVHTDGKWVGRIKLASRKEFKAEGETYFQCVFNLEKALNDWERRSQETLRTKTFEVRKQIASMRKSAKTTAPRENHYGS